MSRMRSTMSIGIAMRQKFADFLNVHHGFRRRSRYYNSRCTLFCAMRLTVKRRSWRFLREMVECESPSNEPKAVDRFVELLIERTRDIGSARSLPPGPLWNACREWNSSARETARKRKDGQLLALGHSDTVWPLGTIRRMPFQTEGRATMGAGGSGHEGGSGVFHVCRRACSANWNVPLERRARGFALRLG